MARLTEPLLSPSPSPSPMLSTSQSAKVADPGRVHAVVSLAMLTVVLGTCLGLTLLSHSASFEGWMRQVRWEEAQRTKHFYWPMGHIANDLDRVLNEEIPAIDHRRGGVYIMGTSNTTWGLKLWDLPDEQRALIYNASTVGTGHEGQGMVLRYLVEREGLLDAGPEKTLVIFGAGYQNVSRPEDEKSFLSQALADRGFYDRGPGGSIERSGISWPSRTIVIERARLSGFATGLSTHFKVLARNMLGRYRNPRVQDFHKFNRARTILMGDHWEAKIVKELAALMESVDYLKAKGAKVLVILMPQGTWEDNLPFGRAYDEELFRLCRSRNLEVLDLRKLVVDDDFADSNHLTPTGVEKFQRALMPICLDHLHSAGLLKEAP